MCGIAGAWGVANKEVLEDMLSCIHHRGPDEGGAFVDRDAGVMLGTRRLSIVDLDGGSQPVSNENGTVVVSFNGEIYNQMALRADLMAEGHRFDTDSDTEVLAHLWEEYGTRMPEHLNGMFAFAVWDATAETLFLARDRLGIKPLYYAIVGDVVWWGSELTTLLAAGVDRSIDERAAYNYFYLRFSPAPRTLFSAIEKVPPGTSLLLDADGTTTHRYWELEPTATPGDADWIATRVRRTLENAVGRRLMADVPLGAFLSGGLDSSAVVGIMSAATDDPVRTFSIGFADEAFDESSEARVVADHFGTDHHEYTVDLDSMDVFDEAIRTLGEPLADPALLPTTLLSHRAREEVKVVLTGEGADELFGGYWYYTTVPKHRKHLSWAPGPVFDISKAIAGATPYGRKYFDFLASLRSDEEILLGVARKYRLEPEAYVDSEMNPRRAGLTELLDDAVSRANDTTQDKLTAYDMHYPLPDNLLYKVDQATMGASLEARVPFLDHSLVELVYGLPPKLKTGGGRKALLKRAVADLLPERTVKREKHGFEVPIGSWFRHDSDAIARWMTEERLEAAPYVDADRVFDLWNDHRRGRRSCEHALWKVLNYVVWYERIVRGTHGGSNGRGDRVHRS